MADVNPLLAGIRVLDLSRLLPGPYCSLYLAQMGADVIKIEDPDGGDYARQVPELFAQVNRGKRSIALDLRRLDDVSVFMRLVETADVVLESFRPGVMEQLGCGYETLKKINPRLVYAALTGYGQTGPYRDRAGHDINYLAVAGVLEQIGAKGSGPAQANVPFADLAGAMNCAIGILGAVIGARASGVGALVDVSITDASAALNVIALASLRQRGKSEARGSDLLSGALPNYTIYQCRDGRYLAIGALEPKFLKRLFQGLAGVLPAALQRLLGAKRKPQADGAHAARGMGDTERMHDIHRLRRQLWPLRALLTVLLWTRRRDDWVKLLEGMDACVTPVLSLEEALCNEQLRARGMVVDDAGRPAFNLPIHFSNAQGRQAASPKLGEDTADILNELNGSSKGSKPAQQNRFKT
jgi:alpha-methylacyl-CoA racemase